MVTLCGTMPREDEKAVCLGSSGNESRPVFRTTQVLHFVDQNFWIAKLRL
jgi:hypothetical protein